MCKIVTLKLCKRFHFDKKGALPHNYARQKAEQNARYFSQLPPQMFVHSGYFLLQSIINVIFPDPLRDDDDRIDGASSSEASSTEDECDSVLWLLSQSNFAFSSALHAKLRSSDRENLVFSPFSLGLTLLATRLGARGFTASEIDAALKFSPELKKDFEAAEAGYLGILESIRVMTSSTSH